MQENQTRVNGPSGLDRAFAALLMLRRQECWCFKGYRCTTCRTDEQLVSVARRSL